MILLDIHLPDGNGFDICGQLREFTTVPIIMITGSARKRTSCVGWASAPTTT